MPPGQLARSADNGGAKMDSRKVCPPKPIGSGGESSAGQGLAGKDMCLTRKAGAYRDSIVIANSASTESDP